MGVLTLHILYNNPDVLHRIVGQDREQFCGGNNHKHGGRRWDWNVVEDMLSCFYLGFAVNRSSKGSPSCVSRSPRP